MLKPWLVYALVWTYKAGLVAMPLVVILLRWRFLAGLPSLRRRIILGCLWVAIAMAGWAAGFMVTTVTYILLCFVLYGLLLLIDEARPITLLLVLPVVASGGYVAWVYSDIVSDKYNSLLPVSEQRLNEQLVCRVYPTWLDSIPATRIVLIRDNGGWWSDEMVTYVDGRGTTPCFHCSIVSHATANMKLWDCSGMWEVHKEVALTGDRPALR